MPEESSHSGSHKEPRPKRARARRRGPKHPGVVLLAPKGRRVAWRSRWEDPDTGQTRWESLESALSTIELREAWAVNKSRALAERRRELALGAPRATGAQLGEAIEVYFRAHTRLAAKTLVGYRAVADKLKNWAKRTHLSSADDLTRAKLMGFAEELANNARRTVVAGGRRGARTDAGIRSQHTINKDLRAASTILGYLVERDLLPRLTRDDLRRALKRQAAPVERLDYLKPAELRAVLAAAMAHDAEVFAATRAEHAAGIAGCTPRYAAIAPYVALVMLTGFRAEHAMLLDWADVELEPEPGVVAPRGGSSTKRKGVVDLATSPALRALLIAMRPNDKNGEPVASGRIFPALTAGVLKASARRLIKDYGAPSKFTFQVLRVSAGSYLTNAAGIFGAASAYRSAAQLGHSVQIAERFYVGLVRGIPPEAKTLEAAYQVVSELAELTERVTRRRDSLSAVD